MYLCILCMCVGACHGDELSYMFYSILFGFTPKANSPEFKMCKIVSKLWTNFAKTGYVYAVFLIVLIH